jgi:glycosyltransferase involved in cell wall biosynthesis
MRLALVHDWLSGMRGGEKVLEVVCERFPNAEIFTLVHVKGSVSPTIERLPIHTSFVQYLPFANRHYPRYLPLFPTAVEQFDLERFDQVLSISHCCVKAILKAPRALHICYCLTPMRYAWDQFDTYFGPDRVGPMSSRLMRPVMARMARWDRDTAGRVDRYVAISHHVADRIGRYYNREASVVYPPVDTAFFHPERSEPERYALVVSALVPYKRIDLAIEACRQARVPLKIVGDGPERSRLERSADGHAEFVGRVSNEAIRHLYRRAAVVLLPGEEDFGIAPLEAQACGRPVVALARGGALETVVHGETGALVNEPTADAFAESILATMSRTFDATVIRRHAERFSRERFGDEIEALVRGPQPSGLTG